MSENINYRYVVSIPDFYSQKSTLIADCRSKESAAEFCGEWLKKIILEGFGKEGEENKKTAGGNFTILVDAVDEIKELKGNKT
jgi:hypothetical protein